MRLVVVVVVAAAVAVVVAGRMRAVEVVEAGNLRMRLDSQDRSQGIRLAVASHHIGDGAGEDHYLTYAVADDRKRSFVGHMEKGTACRMLGEARIRKGRSEDVAGAYALGSVAKRQGVQGIHMADGRSQAGAECSRGSS